MKMKKSKKTNLLIEDGSGIKELIPGDIYRLTLHIDMSSENLSGIAEITANYLWDGKTLKRQIL